MGSGPSRTIEWGSLEEHPYIRKMGIDFVDRISRVLKEIRIEHKKTKRSGNY